LTLSNFDASEPFLAIVSVSAFACLLLDQIAERLAFEKAQAEAGSLEVALNAGLPNQANEDPLERLAELFARFCATLLPTQPGTTRQTESQVVGALHGFLKSVVPELEVQTEARLVAGNRQIADLLVTLGEAVVRVAG